MKEVLCVCGRISLCLRFFASGNCWRVGQFKVIAKGSTKNINCRSMFSSIVKGLLWGLKGPTPSCSIVSCYGTYSLDSLFSKKFSIGTYVDLATSPPD
eukprot:scaffold19886_cov87-Skeletonema_dohrnii-CCMP3373.AAC.2